MSWHDFEIGVPDLALLGLELLNGKIAYLATSKKDGSPRLHPVRPFIGEGQFFLFIDQKSPKRRDILRDGRFALHSSVFQTNGPSTEYLISGMANVIEDPDIREAAHRVVGHDLSDQYTLFEFSVERVSATEYDEERTPKRRRWSCP
jgi:hypothetical protein